MLIKMVNGGMVDYWDNYSYTSGCPTCDYGSSYVTEIEIELSNRKLCTETDNMYSYAIDEGFMLRLFLSNYDYIATLTEDQFISWMREKVKEKVIPPDKLNWRKLRFEDIVKEFKVEDIIHR